MSKLKVVVKKTARKTLMFLLGLAVFLGLFWITLGFFPNPLTDTPPEWDWSVKVADRNGRLLKEFLPPENARREVRPLEDFSPNLIAAILAAEDKRFFSHLGVDPLAMARAVWLNLKHRKIKSGGSTITMQLARLNRGLAPGPRTFNRKFKEIWWALLIERHNSKDVILAEYLNQAPCGNLTVGFPMATQVYLNKSVKSISPAEAAFLAGLPASPGALNPYKDPRPALARRSKVLKRMAKLGSITPDELSRGLVEPLALNNHKPPFKAPHFVSYIRNHYFNNTLPPAVITTSLDLTLQEEVEKIVEETVDFYRDQGLNQASVVVMRLPSREILAWVGSAGFFNAEDGQNDGVTALRQPGSALKPFIYATAFEDGLITPATLLNDQSSDYVVPQGSFSPSNYSGGYHGLVSARLALASSLNLPVVKLTAEVGVPNVLNKLREAGLGSLTESADYYGLALALGGGEVSLLNLTEAYAVLADYGLWRPIRLFNKDELEGPLNKNRRTVFSAATAFIVTDILMDDQARATGFGRHSILETPYLAAVKTGTSKNFRDNWCVGYTKGFVVGVWAGNFQADPMDKVSGITGAGLIWRQVSDLLAKKNPADSFTRPEGLLQRHVCPVSGLLAGADCPTRKLEWFLASKPLPEQCRHLQLEDNVWGTDIKVVGLQRNFGILRPMSNEIYAWDPGLAPEVQQIKAVAQSVPEVDELIWRLNGREIKRQNVSGYERAVCLLPVVKGVTRLELEGRLNGVTVKKSAAGFTIR